jgi:hypothetical protein
MTISRLFVGRIQAERRWYKAERKASIARIDGH